MIGVFIGIAAVISLIGLGEGLRMAVMGQFNFLSTDVLTIQASGLNAGPPGSGVVNALKEDYLKKLEGINGVDMAIGRIIEDAKLEFNGRSDFTFAGSMPDGEKGKEVERIAQFEIAEGRMLSNGETNKVVLGSNYAKEDRFGKGIKIRDKVLVEGKDFDVVGILKKKGSFIVDNVILIKEDYFKKFFDVNDTLDIIVVKIAEGNDISAVKERVEKYLRNERDVKKGEEDFTVESPEQALKNLDSTLFAIQIFVYVIAGISIVVGGIGISNTMYTAVVERTREIGIMKSIGARNSDIFVIFLIESGVLGAAGGLLGVLIGSGIAYGLVSAGKAFLGSDLLRVNISLPLIFGALLFSFLIGSLAGVLPAYQASKMSPVEALSYKKWRLPWLNIHLKA